jgi:hypothetical protein
VYDVLLQSHTDRATYFLDVSSRPGKEAAVMYEYHLQCYLAVSKADVESQIRSNGLKWCL